MECERTRAMSPQWAMSPQRISLERCLGLSPLSDAKEGMQLESPMASGPLYVRVPCNPGQSLSSVEGGTKLGASSDMDIDGEAFSEEGETPAGPPLSEACSENRLEMCEAPGEGMKKGLAEAPAELAPNSEDGEAPSELPAAEVMSVGSKLHAAGECRPCLFFLKGLCFKGAGCLYCHAGHYELRNKRMRPSKKTRKQMERRKEAEDALREALAEVMPALPRRTPKASEGEPGCSGPAGAPIAGAGDEAAEAGEGGVRAAPNTPQDLEEFEVDFLEVVARSVAWKDYAKGKVDDLTESPEFFLPSDEEDVPLPHKFLAQDEPENEEADSSAESPELPFFGKGKCVFSGGCCNSSADVRLPGQDWQHQVWEDSDEEVAVVAEPPPEPPIVYPVEERWESAGSE